MSARAKFAAEVILVVYLLAIGAAGTYSVYYIFPTVGKNSELTFPHDWATNDQQLILLAVAAGIAGSFIHAAQSLSSYLGNEEFKGSWIVWYFLRPWIGGVLAVTIYFVFRAGLVAGATIVNPYGVVALSLLGGWFSKTASDKMHEVFINLFMTDADRQRKDKLTQVPPPTT